MTHKTVMTHFTFFFFFALEQKRKHFHRKTNMTGTKNTSHRIQMAGCFSSSLNPVDKINTLSAPSHRNETRA